MNRIVSAFRRLTQPSRFALGLVLVAAPLFSGCVAVVAGAAAGASAVVYTRGEMRSDLPYEVAAVFGAAHDVLTDMELIKIEEQKTVLDGELLYRTALDKQVKVRLERVTDGVTRIKIRVGVVGDQALSLTVLDKIKARLR